MPANGYGGFLASSTVERIPVLCVIPDSLAIGDVSTSILVEYLMKGY